MCTFIFSFGIFCSLNIVAQTATLNNTNICKHLAIQSAQLANQSYIYSQKSHFENNLDIADKNIDTAIIFIKESIFSIDSALVLASDSDILGIKYANIAKNFAIDSYYTLDQYTKSKNNYQKNELSKKATFYSANATTDAYHASFYFNGEKKAEKIIAEPALSIPKKQITKLDIDQTLFTLLKEELHQKKEINAQEIIKLSAELSAAKDPTKQSKLKTQLKELELKAKELDKKNSEAQQKLTSINTLIDERDKNKTNFSEKEETVFSKGIINTSDEWNNQVKLDMDLPANLVYQIQLGVYKNSVLPEIFKGLTPIYGKTTEKGVSYATGLFEKLTDAKEAKSYILNMGFTDVFIVAYYNKIKITLTEAVKLEKNKP